jgi:hypothetical protein
VRRVLLVCVLAALVAAAPALADGDPASDVLFSQQIFLPFDARTSTAAVKNLIDTVYAANAAGVKVRVAIIAKPADLGAVPGLFGKPERYARFLGGEITFGWKGLVLIAMPTGLGISRSYHPAPREQATVAKVKPKPGAGVDDLATAAADAVRRLAAAEGHRLPGVSTPRRGGSTDTRDRIIIGVSAAVAAAVVGGLVLLRRQRANRSRG